jgi:hypothetical protein
MRVIVVTFAHGAYHENQERQRKQALAHGADEVLALRLDTLEASKTVKDYIRHTSRGAGYMLWKPLALRQARRRAQPGDVLMYCDAGTQVTGDLRALATRTVRSGGILAFRLKRLWVRNILIGAAVCAVLLWGIVAWRGPRKVPHVAALVGVLVLVAALMHSERLLYAQRAWTKRSALEAFFGVTDYDAWCAGNGMQPQVMSGFVFLEVGNPVAERLLERWGEALALERAALFDDTPCAGNTRHFVESRHDQMMLSCLLYEEFSEVVPQLPWSTQTSELGLRYHYPGRHR